MNTQIHNWIHLIQSAHASASIINSRSVELFIGELSLAYGNLTTAGTIATERSENLKLLLNQAPSKPNERQLALA
jgi:hypothetical protein